ALHPVADPRDDVGAERRLAVEGRAQRLGHAGAQVHQGADHRGRAEIKGNAVALLARIPGLDGNQMIATEHGGHLELGAPKERRQPASNSPGRSCLRSAVVISAAPWSTWTLHLPQVPRPPQVESIGRPIQCAALNRVVPGGTLVALSNGW